MVLRNVLLTCYHPAHLNHPETWIGKEEGVIRLSILSPDRKSTLSRSFPSRFIRSVTMNGCGIVPGLGVIAFDGEKYYLLDPQRFPWGQGARGQPIYPDKTIAVDPRPDPSVGYPGIPLGKTVTIVELAGIRGHNGEVTAGDTGGKIKRYHVDLFVASPKELREYYRGFKERGAWAKADNGVWHPRVTLVY